MIVKRFAAGLIGSAALLLSLRAEAGPAEPFARSANFVNVKLSPKGDRVAVTRRV